MAGEVTAPRRTMPRALVGGIALVTAIYAVATLGFMRAAAGQAPGSDEALVAAIGASLFGSSGSGALTAIVVVAVGGSLAATLLGSPRLYLAMARDGLFPTALARFDRRAGNGALADAGAGDPGVRLRRDRHLRPDPRLLRARGCVLPRPLCRRGAAASSSPGPRGLPRAAPPPADPALSHRSSSACWRSSSWDGSSSAVVGCQLSVVSCRLSVLGEDLKTEDRRPKTTAVRTCSKTHRDRTRSG